MRHHPEDRIYRRKMTRRDFLWLASLSTAVVSGCAVDPVTGKSQLMLVSEDQEIQLDQQNSPHQFSSDYGPVQDQALNRYLGDVGTRLVNVSHRPDMPYSFRAVNATYVNAYAFPGGSIATTRGILLALDNEAELAGLLGHEIGHVNARHTAERMTKGLLVSGLVAIGTIYVESKHKKWAPLAAGLGNIAGGVLLAHYSRENEREADSLGMEYMALAGYPPQGMVGLMDVLRSLSKHKPGALEMMFSTHPMSDERYDTAQKEAEAQYAYAQDQPDHRERYMDYTAGLRQMKGAIEAMQEGEKAMVTKNYRQAESAFERALQEAPYDYAGLLMMAKCQLTLENPRQADYYAERAKQIYPQEAQAHHLCGFSKIQRDQFDAAYENFDDYERLLPGNPNTVFFKGVSQEGMQHQREAANEYYRYLQMVDEGDQAQYAYTRLVEWGYVTQ